MGTFDLRPRPKVLFLSGVENQCLYYMRVPRILYFLSQVAGGMSWQLFPSPVTITILLGDVVSILLYAIGIRIHALIQRILDGPKQAKTLRTRLLGRSPTLGATAYAYCSSLACKDNTSGMPHASGLVFALKYSMLQCENYQEVEWDDHFCEYIKQ